MQQPAAPVGHSQRRSIPGVRKAAVLLLSLSETEAAAVLRRLPVDEVEQLSREIARIGDVPAPLRDRVLQEFYELAQPIGDAGNELECEGGARAGPFGYLGRFGTGELVALMQDETPQSIALILAHLPPARAGEVLASLLGQQQIDVVRRIANLQTASTEFIQRAVQDLERRLLNRLAAEVPA